MNKSDKLIVGILVLLLIGWFWKNNRDAAAYAEAERARIEAAQAAAATNAVPAAAVSGLPSDTAFSASPATNAVAQVPPSSASVRTRTDPDHYLAVTNALPNARDADVPSDLVFGFSSHGGTLTNAVLGAYDKALDPAEGPVAMRAADAPGIAPTLALTGLEGLGRNDDFAIVPAPGGVEMAGAGAGSLEGLSFVRSVAATNGYHLLVTETFSNGTDRALSVPRHGLALGPMRTMSAHDPDAELGIDLRLREADGSLATLQQSATEAFVDGGDSFASLFGGSGGGCSSVSIRPDAPVTAGSAANVPPGGAVEWLAVRDRFFVQILTPRAGFTAQREVRTSLDRRMVPEAPSALALNGVGTELVCEGFPLAPGASATRAYSLYVGPRKLSEMRAEDAPGTKQRHDEIMRFGTWSWFCRILLDLLNFIHDHVVSNYGWAIIVLTILVRLLLWPISRKSTESMRRMSEIQPLIKDINEKYKDDPRKRQQEMMRIYQEHHVNPLASCLPMLIQLPIFIALFTVLRSSVELRYAGFLWISDLSEPENCFKETLGFGINFLPIAMAVTMTLQSRMTPSTGDAKQQRMMTVMMPVMMLVMCYQFASALGLYWTVSQALAIFTMWRARRKGGAGAASKKTGDDGVEVIPPPRETRQMRRHRS